MAETRLTLNEAAVRIGGSMPDKDVPNINMGRDFLSGTERCFLNANFPVPVPGGTKFKEEGGRLSLSAGGHGHVFYPLPGGDLEYELVLNRRPAADSFAFNLTFSEGLSFNFQPALDKDPEVLNNPLVATVTPTEARDAKGKLLYRRPEHIVESYAVYWKNAGHYRRGDGSTAVNYRTGKFGHIHRPRLVDALGREKWAGMEITPTSRTTASMTITADKAWLDSAAYPVTLDPTFGYDTVGGSSGSVGQNEIFASGMGAPAADGTVTAINIYCSTSGNPDVTVGLYADSSGPDAKVGSENENPNVGNLSADWQAFSTDSLPVSNGINYWPSANSSSDITVYYDSAGGTNRYWDNTSYGDPWPSTFSQDSSSGAMYSMYADYTEGGTSVAVSDSGSGADALAAVNVALSLADSGAGADATGGLGAGVPVGDSGGGSDEVALVLAALAVGDSGLGSDEVSVLAELLKKVSDAAAAADQAGVSVALSVGDSGAGAGSAAVGVSLTIADSGAGTDSVSTLQQILKAVADAAAGSDTLGQVSVRVPVSDSGHGLDATAAIGVVLGVLDSAGGVDAVIRFTGAESGYMTVTFAARGPGVAFAGRGPSAGLSGRGPKVTFKGG